MSFILCIYKCFSEKGTVGFSDVNMRIMAKKFMMPSHLTAPFILHLMLPVTCRTSHGSEFHM